MSRLHPSIKLLSNLSGPIFAIFVFASPTLSFTLTFTDSREDINSNDQIDWANLGPVEPPQPFKILPFDFTSSSEQGLNVNVNIPPAGDPAITPPLVFQTNDPGIETNFAPGDFILFTGLNPAQFPSPGNPGPLSLKFETPVSGAGAQIAVDDTPNFNASISAYDRDNNLLGNFSAPGTSSLALDDSALFLGAVSDEANISRLEFRSSIPNRAIGINRLSIRVAEVPEPSAILGAVVVGLGLVAAKRRRSKLNKPTHPKTFVGK